MTGWERLRRVSWFVFWVQPWLLPVVVAIFRLAEIIPGTVDPVLPWVVVVILGLTTIAISEWLYRKPLDISSHAALGGSLHARQRIGAGWGITTLFAGSFLSIITPGPALPILELEGLVIIGLLAMLVATLRLRLGQRQFDRLQQEIELGGSDLSVRDAWVDPKRQDS